MKKILINFAHPAKSRSKINQALRAAVEGIEGVTINDLYSNYPDFFIDVKKEQALCEDHDVIIFQHPFYWYQAPSIVKEWQDLVLEHGWAYGSEGNALKGKLCLQALTAGADDQMYQRDGANKFTIPDLTTPFRAMANLCKMVCLPPFTILGIHRGIPENELRVHAESYRQLIMDLRNDILDMKVAGHCQNLNNDMYSHIRRS